MESIYHYNTQFRSFDLYGSFIDPNGVNNERETVVERKKVVNGSWIAKVNSQKGQITYKALRSSGDCNINLRC